MSKSLLMVDDGAPLRGLLEEGEEFVSFRDRSDLIEKVTHLLDNDQRRLEIAAAGHDAFLRRHRLGNPWYVIHGD